MSPRAYGFSCFLGSFAILTIVAGSAYGQDSLRVVASQRDSSTALPHSFCLKPAPAAKCDAFLLLEGGGLFPWGGTKTAHRPGAADTLVRDLGRRLDWGIGVMMNRSAHIAFGALLSGGETSTGHRTSATARLRGWVRGGAAHVDAGAGLVRARVNAATGTATYTFGPSVSGFTADLAVGSFYYVSGVIGVDYLSGGRHSAYVGLRLESLPALGLLAGLIFDRKL